MPGVISILRGFWNSILKSGTKDLNMILTIIMYKLLLSKRRLCIMMSLSAKNRYYGRRGRKTGWQTAIKFSMKAEQLRPL